MNSHLSIKRKNLKDKNHKQLNFNLTLINTGFRTHALTIVLTALAVKEARNKN